MVQFGLHNIIQIETILKYFKPTLDNFGNFDIL